MLGRNVEHDLLCFQFYSELFVINIMQRYDFNISVVCVCVL